MDTVIVVLRESTPHLPVGRGHARPGAPPRSPTAAWQAQSAVMASKPPPPPLRRAPSSPEHPPLSLVAPSYFLPTRYSPDSCPLFSDDVVVCHGLPRQPSTHPVIAPLPYSTFPTVRSGYTPSTLRIGKRGSLPLPLFRPVPQRAPLSSPRETTRQTPLPPTDSPSTTTQPHPRRRCVGRRGARGPPAARDPRLARRYASSKHCRAASAREKKQTKKKKVCTAL